MESSRTYDIFAEEEVTSFEHTTYHSETITIELTDKMGNPVVFTIDDPYGSTAPQPTVRLYYENEE